MSALLALDVFLWNLTLRTSIKIYRQNQNFFKNGLKIRSPLFRDITQRIVVIPYRRFGTDLIYDAEAWYHAWVKNVENYNLRSKHFILFPARLNCHKSEIASGCTLVYPSVRIYQHGLHLTDTRAPFDICNFMKICQENSDLVKIGLKLRALSHEDLRTFYFCRKCTVIERSCTRLLG
jgi:hypothetical protein